MHMKFNVKYFLVNIYLSSNSILKDDFDSLYMIKKLRSKVLLAFYIIIRWYHTIIKL